MGGLNPRLLALVPSITCPLSDNTRVGSFWIRLNVNFAAANTNTNIQHGLGRKPTGYIVMGRRQVGDLYDDGTQAGWTHEQIVLKAETVGNYDIWIA